MRRDGRRHRQTDEGLAEVGDLGGLFDDSEHTTSELLQKPYFP